MKNRYFLRMLYNNVYGNNDRVVRDLQRFIRGKGVEGWEIIHHPPGRKDLLESIKTGKGKLSSSSPDMTKVLHFRADLVFVKVVYSGRSQVFTRAVQGSDLFSASLAIDRGNGVSLRKHPFIAIDGNSGPAR